MKDLRKEYRTVLKDRNRFCLLGKFRKENNLRTVSKNIDVSRTAYARAQQCSRTNVYEEKGKALGQGNPAQGTVRKRCHIMDGAWDHEGTGTVQIMYEDWHG
jgi:hypothetical protein